MAYHQNVGWRMLFQVNEGAT